MSEYQRRPPQGSPVSSEMCQIRFASHTTPRDSLRGVGGQLFLSRRYQKNACRRQDKAHDVLPIQALAQDDYPQRCS